MVKRYPVCEPTLVEKEKEYLNLAYDSGFISGAGEYVEKLENSFSNFLGSKYAIAVNNGTSAVHLMVLASGLNAGDEVIVPSFTMAGSIFPLIYAGVVPVFVDADPQTWCIDVSRIENMITKDTRAIMAVHIYGYPCDMVVINKIAEKYGLLVLEDAAESLGSTLFGEKCGVLSECSAFSLFANKVVTSGEGGMVVTNNEKVYNRARYLRNLAFPLSGPRDYIHDEVGYNYRLSNLLAAIGVAQMENIDKLVQSRSNNANLYMEILNKDNRIGFQPNSGGIYNSRWMFGITLNQELSRYANSVRKQLAELGIETRPFFKPMHSQKAIRNKPNRVDGEMPVSNTLGETGFYLPSSSHLKSDEIIEISENLLEIVAKLEC